MSPTIVSLQDALKNTLKNATDWDVAVRYHEFRGNPGYRDEIRKLRTLSARAILDRARSVLGAVVHPRERICLPLSELESGSENIDLNLDETIENSVFGNLKKEEIWVDYSRHQTHSLVLSVDTSLSMTGEKLALTAVALAVVLLQFPDDPIGIVAFENEAKVLKHPEERISIGELLERFLDIPAEGYTHLEDGLRSSLELLERAMVRKGRPPSTVLLTDGKYTAGKDPSYLASRFPHLVVIKMGKDRSSRELCLELANKGSGLLREVGKLEVLPYVMYGVVKDLLRGRSVA